MRLEFLERYSEGDGPLHRLDARVKLVATLAFVVLVVATPVGLVAAPGGRGPGAGLRGRALGSASPVAAGPLARVFALVGSSP